ncbi:MAG: hypothetical protein ACLTW9_30280 [Enterocloster sp.]
MVSNEKEITILKTGKIKEEILAFKLKYYASQWQENKTLKKSCHPEQKVNERLDGWLAE